MAITSGQIVVFSSYLVILWLSIQWSLNKNTLLSDSHRKICEPWVTVLLSWCCTRWCRKTKISINIAASVIKPCYEQMMFNYGCQSAAFTLRCGGFFCHLHFCPQVDWCRKIFFPFVPCWVLVANNVKSRDKHKMQSRSSSMHLIRQVFTLFSLDVLTGDKRRMLLKIKTKHVRSSLIPERSVWSHLVEQLQGPLAWCCCILVLGVQ